MSCSIKPSGYRYWIDKEDGSWYRSEDPLFMGAALIKDGATKDGAPSRRRVEQPVRFPDADDALLVAMLGFLDVSVVGLAAQINRRCGVGRRARARSGNALSSGATLTCGRGWSRRRLATRARCIAGWPVPGRGGRRRRREYCCSLSSSSVRNWCFRRRRRSMKYNG